LSEDLLCVAEDLINTNDGAPHQAHLRRAVSSVYYALFHFLAQQCADNFIGAEPDTKTAWWQVYRALDHGAARKACEQCVPCRRCISDIAKGIDSATCERCYSKKFPAAIQDYAELFGTYQDKRHKADYDPFVSFSKKDVTDMIGEVQSTLEAFEGIDIKHRKAFSAFVLLRPPRR